MRSRMGRVALAAATGALLFQPTPSFAGYDSCNAERPTPRSSIESVYLRFVNHTSHDANIDWVTFEGNRQLYRTLRPNESYSQQTYVGHVWVVTHPNNVCNFVYTADSGGGDVDIY